MSSSSSKKSTKGQVCPHCGHINKRSYTWCRRCNQELKPNQAPSKTSISLRVADSHYQPPEDYEESDDFFSRAEKLAIDRKEIEHVVEEIRRRDEVHIQSIIFLVLFILGSIALRSIITLFLSGSAVVDNYLMTVLDITISTILAELVFVYTLLLLGNFFSLVQGNFTVAHKVHWRIISHLYPGLFTASIFWISFANRGKPGLFTILLLALGIILGLMIAYDVVMVMRYEFRISYPFSIMVGLSSLYLRNTVFGLVHGIFTNSILGSYYLPG